MADYRRLVYRSPGGAVSFYETSGQMPVQIGDAELVGPTSKLVEYALDVLALQMSTERRLPPAQRELARLMGAKQSQISRWANGANLRLPPGHPGWRALCDLIVTQAAGVLPCSP